MDERVLQQELNELVHLGLADAKSSPNGEMVYKITKRGIRYAEEHGLDDLGEE